MRSVISCRPVIYVVSPKGELAFLVLNICCFCLCSWFVCKWVELWCNVILLSYKVKCFVYVSVLCAHMSLIILLSMCIACFSACLLEAQVFNLSVGLMLLLMISITVELYCTALCGQSDNLAFLFTNILIEQVFLICHTHMQRIYELTSIISFNSESIVCIVHILHIQFIANLLHCWCGFRYGSIWKGCLTLYSGKGGDVHKIGEYVSGSFAYSLLSDYAVVSRFCSLHF